jgi:glycosyltransferase involved in cell wall biosynthesis
MNELSIIIPVLSNFEKVQAFIDTLGKYLMANPGDIDIIVVVDQTVQNPESLIAYTKKKDPWLRLRVLQRFGVGSIHNYGALVRFGMAYSTSKYVVLVSPHGEDDLSILSTMLAKVRKDCQVVQATRYAHPADAKNVGLVYRAYQSIYRLATRVFLGLESSDSTYAYKMFDRVFIQAIGVTRNRFSVCPEITIKSLLAGGKVEYVSSTVKRVEGIHDFKLVKEGVGYILLIVRGFLHRLGILWF